MQKHPCHLRTVHANFQGRTLNALCSQLVPVSIYITNDLGRVPHDDGVGGNRTRHHRPRRHHGVVPNSDAWENNSPRANGSTLLHHRLQVLLRLLLATREAIIGERGIWPNEYIVAHPQTIPQLHPTFHRDAVANDHVVLDQAVRADVAVATDPGARQDDDKLPDAGAGTDGLRLNV